MSQLKEDWIREKILKIEKKFPVEEWKVNNIHIWPIIRIRIFIFLLNSSESKKDAYKKTVNVDLKKTFENHLVFRVAKAFFNLLSFFTNLKEKKIIFFGSHFHRTHLKGLYFNRFFDSMVDFHKLQDLVYVVEFQKILDPYYNPKAILPLHKYLDEYKLLKRIFSSLKKTNSNVQLKEFDTFFKHLQLKYPHFANEKISKEVVVNLALKINLTKGFFSRLYQKTNPEKIILLSSFGFDDLYAAILASKELGITSIDFQHGPQTNIHMAYSSWTKIPEGGYNILPDEYWCWDEYSKQNIEQWSFETKIKAKNVGNPFVNYILKNKEIEEFAINKAIFSMQLMPLEQMLPIRLLQLIKDGGLFLEIRKHPRNTFSDDEIKEYLNSLGVFDFEISDASTKPLPVSLSESLIHITNFSGCVLEASFMNVPSLVIHKTGYQIYEQYIDNKLVFFNDFTNIYESNKVVFQDIVERAKKVNRQIRRIEIYNPIK